MVHIVNIMNYDGSLHPDQLLPYQAQRLQELLADILLCCQGRMVHQSRKFNLPQSELNCLMLFLSQPYLTVKHISAKLEVAKSRVSKILDGLEDKGLIQRSQDPTDARVRLVSLTPAGQKKAAAIAEFIAEIHQLLLAQLQPEQRQEVLSSLEVLHASMEAIKSRMSF